MNLDRDGFIEVTEENIDALFERGVENGKRLRLQQLLEEFEAARHHLALSYATNSDGFDQRDYNQLILFEAEYWASYPGHAFYEDILALGQSLVSAASRYIIARDFNEFRDGHWQTLWKLTYGGSL